MIPLPRRVAYDEFVDRVIAMEADTDAFDGRHRDIERDGTTYLAIEALGRGFTRRPAMNNEPRFSKSSIGLASALLIGIMSLATNAHADPKGCTSASLNGSFGFYRTGTTSAGPLAALGILFFDGKGTVSGSQSISRNGTFQFDIVVAPSPYIVNADCTGKLLAADGVTEVGRIVVTDGGTGFYVLSESSGNAVHGVGRKIGESSDSECGSELAVAAKGCN